MIFKKYYAIGRMNFQEKTRYLLESSLYSLFIVFILFIFFSMWKVLYGDKDVIGEFTFAQMIWYLAFSETINFAISLNRIEQLGDEIKQGSVVNTLLKPYHFLGREFSINLSEFIYKFLLYGLIGFVFTYFLVGLIPFSLTGLTMALFAAIGALILNFFIITSFGMLVFWFEESSATYWIYQKMIFILGGMLLPLDFYPEGIVSIIKYLPPAYIMYGPSKLFVHPNVDLFVNIILGQILWILAFFVIMYLIYKKGIKEVNLNGG